MIHEKNRVITTKKGKGKLPLFCDNGEQVIPIYAGIAVQAGDDGSTNIQGSTENIRGTASFINSCNTRDTN